MVGVQPLVVAVCQFEPVVGPLHDAVSTGFNPHPFNSTLTCFRSFPLLRPKFLNHFMPEW